MHHISYTGIVSNIRYDTVSVWLYTYNESSFFAILKIWYCRLTVQDFLGQKITS